MWCDCASLRCETRGNHEFCCGESLGVMQGTGDRFLSDASESRVGLSEGMA